MSKDEELQNETTNCPDDSFTADKNSCPAMNDGYECTRPTNHAGDHHAHAGPTLCCKVWGSETDVDALITTCKNIGRLTEELRVKQALVELDERAFNTCEALDQHTLQVVRAKLYGK